MTIKLRFEITIFEGVRTFIKSLRPLECKRKNVVVNRRKKKESAQLDLLAADTPAVEK